MRLAGEPHQIPDDEPQLEICLSVAGYSLVLKGPERVIVEPLKCWLEMTNRVLTHNIAHAQLQMDLHAEAVRAQLLQSAGGTAH